MELTTPASVMGNLDFCVRHGIHAVVGTTGWTDDRLAQLKGWLDQSPETGRPHRAELLIGAVLTMKFAQIAAPYFESVEVVELHHPNKVDAPSGTATRTAQLIAEARRQAGSAPAPDATATPSTAPAARTSTGPGARDPLRGLSPTRRSCSAARARPHRPPTTPCTTAASCRASCSAPAAW
ncbi:hypothetical protein GCM10023238_13060 [Streptomyces heliomycini]